MDTHLLNHHVVEESSGSSVAAFINETIAKLWALEYSEKTGLTLIVRSTSA